MLFRSECRESLFVSGLIMRAKSAIIKRARKRTGDEIGSLSWYGGIFVRGVAAVEQPGGTPDPQKAQDDAGLVFAGVGGAVCAGGDLPLRHRIRLF